MLTTINLFNRNKYDTRQILQMNIILVIVILLEILIVLLLLECHITS